MSHFSHRKTGIPRRKKLRVTADQDRYTRSATGPYRLPVGKQPPACDDEGIEAPVGDLLFDLRCVAAEKFVGGRIFRVVMEEAVAVAREKVDVPLERDAETGCGLALAASGDARSRLSGHNVAPIRETAARGIGSDGWRGDRCALKQVPVGSGRT